MNVAAEAGISTWCDRAPPSDQFAKNQSLPSALVKRSPAEIVV